MISKWVSLDLYRCHQSITISFLTWDSTVKDQGGDQIVVLLFLLMIQRETWFFAWLVIKPILQSFHFPSETFILSFNSFGLSLTFYPTYLWLLFWVKRSLSVQSLFYHFLSTKRGRRWRSKEKEQETKRSQWSWQTTQKLQSFQRLDHQSIGFLSADFTSVWFPCVFDLTSFLIHHLLK